MRLWTVLTIFFVFGTSANAQAALQALAKELPPCSLACFMSEIPKTTCANNLTSECLCTNEALNAAVTLCASKTCTVYELLQTKNISSTSCGAPVRSSGRKFIVLGTAGIGLAVLSFILRMAACLKGRSISWDDAAMALVVALAIPPAAFGFMLIDNGLGRDMWTLKDYQITNVLFYYFMGEIFYILALGFSKISILFFYLRVFPAREFRMQIYGVMALCGAYTIAFFFATTFQCIPVSLAWTQWDGLHAGKCNDIHLQGWVAAAINILLDVIVMVLPLKHLAGLNMTLKRKLMVMSMFSVGAIVIFTSAMRLYSLVHFANSHNITWDYVEAGYWSLIEVDVSIICGCMPAHRMLIARAWPKIKLTFHSTKGNSMNSKDFTAASKSNALTSDKAVRVSIKPQTKDDREFVPLVDIDTRNIWTQQTATKESSRSNLSAAESCESDHSDGWPIGRSTTSREHV
ncbi:uncharacterized protein CC84DRAFT_1191485 [Paraphaeosphaeria sporulosa]|uniref:CFEM domain-containing protein n=1 Tax=Paraphaeosphaeria sporulosa TaxID=1460663 RepID=A0A177BWX3_9PLEO|nr:uncharacterized protein CC84DRAFT_1191485 [Paraphaeosphaeria sporulosa]OAF99007.1 hypothetical protein CC84DRAFT_1191485 [Paraphaeosphaeria sporulosa]